MDNYAFNLYLKRTCHFYGRRNEAIHLIELSLDGSSALNRRSIQRVSGLVCALDEREVLFGNLDRWRLSDIRIPL